MATIEPMKTRKTEGNNTFSGTVLPSWSREQKIAMIASFAILGILLAVIACSKQSTKMAAGGESSQTSAPHPMSVVARSEATVAANSTKDIATALATTKVKKSPRKRAVEVTYSDPNSGVSFLYPRRFTLASGEKGQPESLGTEVVPMNFVHPGGVPVATVALPGDLYPGTDFASGFFSVNVNRSLPEEECPHFAFVDTSNPDGEPIDAQKVKVGAPDALKEMEMTSEFEGNATRQIETQYYHDYENGACYEYVLGLGTAGYGSKEGVEPVNRDEVFARLGKILGTVKVRPVGQEHPASEPAVAEQTSAGGGGGK